MDLNNTAGNYDSLSLTEARLDALTRVVLLHDGQEPALQVAAAAIKAYDAGPEAFASFKKKQNEKGLSIEAVTRSLCYLPTEKQLAGVEFAINYAKAILSHEKYMRFLECSDRGDIRLSPHHAKLKIRGIERTIDEFYQNAKRTADGGHVEKGQPFDHIIDPFTGDKFPSKEATWLYRGLWITYFTKNPDLVKYAEQFDSFTNIYTQTTKAIEDRYEFLIEAYVKGGRDRYVSVVQCSDWYKNMQKKLKKPLSEQIDSAASRVAKPESSDKPLEKEPTPVH